MSKTDDRPVTLTVTLTDNEWAAGFCGLTLINLRAEGVKWTTDDWWWCAGERDAWKSDPHLGPKSRKLDWNPDSDLNHFKLVLDKYRDSLDREVGSPMGMANPYAHIRMTAWDDPEVALKAIRQAVEAKP